MVNAFRYGFLGFADIDISHALILILVFIVVLLSFAYYLLSRGVGIRS
jgi:ABC-2 type transport system permease protein